MPCSQEEDSFGRVGIQGSVDYTQLRLGWLPGIPWAAPVEDQSTRPVGIQGPVYYLWLEGLGLTFPKSSHNQGDQIQDSSKHSSPPLNDTQH